MGEGIKLKSPEWKKIVFLFTIFGIASLSLLNYFLKPRLILAKCRGNYRKGDYFYINGVEFSADKPAKKESFSIVYLRPNNLFFKLQDGNHTMTTLFNTAEGGYRFNDCIVKCGIEKIVDCYTNIADSIKGHFVSVRWRVLPLISEELGSIDPEIENAKVSFCGIETVNKIGCYKLAFHDGYNWSLCLWIGTEDFLIHKIRRFDCQSPPIFDPHANQIMWQCEAYLFYYLPFNLGLNEKEALKNKKYKDCDIFYQMKLDEPSKMIFLHPKKLKEGEKQKTEKKDENNQFNSKFNK